MPQSWPCYASLSKTSVRVPCASGEKNALRQLQILNRLHVLYEPFSSGVQAIKLRSGRISMTPTTAAPTYQMVVVDESHHIYRDEALRLVVERHVGPGSQRLIISDVSQSLGG